MSKALRGRQTRDRLIATTIALVGERSYQGASVFEVAKAAGVTPGALQHHFGSKAVLMMRVVDEILRSGDTAGVVWPSASLALPARASAYVRLMWTQVYEPPRFLAAWQVYFGSCSDPELRDYIASQRAALAESLHRRFAALFPEAAASEGLEAFVDLLLSALRGIGLARLFGPATALCDAQLQALADLIVLRCSAVSSPTALSRRSNPS
jgi:AcrR family transcriptional regulator